MLSFIKTTGITIVVSIVCICILHVCGKHLVLGIYSKKKTLYSLKQTNTKKCWSKV